MKPIQLFLLLALLGCGPSIHFLPGLPPNLSPDLFHRNESKASFLYQYDMVFWWTSDSVSNAARENPYLASRLGPEQFCIKEGDNWYATFGKWDSRSHKYVPAINFLVESKPEITISRRGDPALPQFANDYAWALHQAMPFIDKAVKTHQLKLNWYVVPTDSTVEIWALPESVSPNGVAYYGGEYCYTFNRQDYTLLDSREINIKYRGHNPNPEKTITLNDTINEVPSISAIFYCLLHKRHFDFIIIQSKTASTGFLYDAVKNDYTWVHVVE
jgi:hypothetical protein